MHTVDVIRRNSQIAFPNKKSPEGLRKEVRYYLCDFLNNSVNVAPGSASLCWPAAESRGCCYSKTQSNGGAAVARLLATRSTGVQFRVEPAVIIGFSAVKSTVKSAV